MNSINDKIIGWFSYLRYYNGSALCPACTPLYVVVGKRRYIALFPSGMECALSTKQFTYHKFMTHMARVIHNVSIYL